MSSKITSKLDKDKPRQYTLDDFEFAYIVELTELLRYHIARDQIISNFLTYIAQQRFGYGQVQEGYRLKFDLDTIGPEDALKGIVKISEVKA